MCTGVTFRLEAGCGFLFRFLLPPRKAGFVFGRQFGLLLRLFRRFGRRWRSLGRQNRRRGLFLLCFFFLFCQTNEPPATSTVPCLHGGSANILISVFRAAEPAAVASVILKVNST